MPTIDAFKEQETPPTPLLLFDCTLPTGAVERWSTHAVTVSGNAYAARLLQHNLFTLQASSIDGLDGAQKLSVTLGNADSHFSQIEREIGFKGSVLAVNLVFYDLVANLPASDPQVVFRGMANPPDEIAEATLRVSFTTRLNLQRVILPEVAIERRCPWLFPSTAAQRAQALDGGANGSYSALYRCGYSADQTGGVGNLNGTAAFTSCDYTRASCVARGMFNTDSAARTTRRFGGIEFVPSQIDVRSFGEQGSHASAVIDNTALYNDYVPLMYGTAWYKPPIVFTRNDGNLTHMEVLLGMGPIEGVVKVLVNGIEIPQGQTGVSMTATGWYNVVTTGTRSGTFNPDFADGTGKPLGDPYGSMAMASVVVPNQISNGLSLPKIEVLLQGLMLETFDTTGASLGETFTNNPVWVLLDVLRRSGWAKTDIDLVSFAQTAAYCDALISTTDLYGNSVAIPRFQCNLVIQTKSSAAEVVKGIRNGSSLLLAQGANGLQARIENTLALQQPALPAGGNSTAELNGGWPVYEFSDSSATFSGILRTPKGDPSLKLWSRLSADTPNRLTVEFQDEFNEYTQDSLALVDVNDSLLTSREVTAAFPAVGLPNFDQATRMLQLQLNKTIAGYTFIDFQTTVRGARLAPGDLITITYLKEGFTRQPFRIVKLLPGLNYETVSVTAQWHDDAWYTTGGSSAAGGRNPGAGGAGLPNPLVGSVIDANGNEQFGVTEAPIETPEGSPAVELTVSFSPPGSPGVSAAAIPLVGLSPIVQTTGGTLEGGVSFYYAVTGVDASGAESGLSFLVRGATPAGTNTNQVSLTALSFSPGTTAFNVYRGTNPNELLRIATNVAIAGAYTDSGATVQLIAPPDPNYNHANFYWRWELQPEAAANLASATTIGNSGLGMLPDDFQGALVRITRGTGATQERLVTANNGTTLTVTPGWTVVPDTTSYFTVAETTWNFGGVSTASPASLQVPNRFGSSVEISGRAANTQDQESLYALNPLTSWQIGGGAGADPGLPPMPSFGVSLTGQGTVELAGVSFTDLTNTHTITAGSLTLFYWNELNGPSTISLASAVAATDTTITVSAAISAQPGDLIQIEAEVVAVVTAHTGGTVFDVTRGSHGTTASAHAATILTYLLERNVTVVAFVSQFFGSPASGSYTQSIFLPDVRIAAAEFFVTNSRGNSPVASAAFTGTTDQGLRTLSGGQITIQVEGYLAVETSAAPPFVIEAEHVPRDIFAVLGEAPSGGALGLQLRQNSTVYCSLTVADGQTVSNTVNGFGLPPLAMGAQLSLDILSVPTAANSLPGKNLTVTVRL